MIITKEEIIEADNFINTQYDRIVEWQIGDIKRCCRLKKNGTCGKNGALVGAFILWCCAIDYFGGLFTGLTSRRGTKARFKAFVEKYMPRYNASELCDLRWALLHYYSVRHTALCHLDDVAANKDIHLSKVNGQTLLHLGISIMDLEKAVKQYSADLKSDTKLKIKLLRYNKVSFPLYPINLEIPIKHSSFSSLATGTSIQNVSASGTTNYITMTKNLNDG